METKQLLRESIHSFGVSWDVSQKEEIRELGWQANLQEKAPITKEEYEQLFAEVWEEIEILKGVEKYLEPADITQEEPKYTIHELMLHVKKGDLSWLGDGTRSIAYFETGIPWIDSNHGLEKRTILTAPSNTGKTLLAIQIARSVSMLGKPVLYLDFETSIRDLWLRFLTQGTNLTKEDMLTRGKLLLKEELTNKRLSNNARKAKNVYSPELSGIETLDDMADMIDAWQEGKNEGLVIIDQITGLKRFTGADTQFEQTQKIADWLREGVKDKPWTILALSPQNKANYNKGEVVSITGSGELGYAVDAIWAISKKLGENEEKWNRRSVTLDILKSRSGSLKEFNFDLIRNSEDEFELGRMEVEAEDVAKELQAL